MCVVVGRQTASHRRVERLTLTGSREARSGPVQFGRGAAGHSRSHNYPLKLNENGGGGAQRQDVSWAGGRGYSESDDMVTAATACWTRGQCRAKRADGRSRMFADVDSLGGVPHVLRSQVSTA